VPVTAPGDEGVFLVRIEIGSHGE